MTVTEEAMLIPGSKCHFPFLDRAQYTERTLEGLELAERKGSTATEGDALTEPKAPGIDFLVDGDFGEESDDEAKKASLPSKMIVPEMGLGPTHSSRHRRHRPQHPNRQPTQT